MSVIRSRDMGFAPPLTEEQLTTWATVGSTTGSPTTGQFTYLGTVHNFWKFTATGVITFATAGKVKALIVAGGGACGIDGGGGGGGFISIELVVPAEASPVVIGAGGSKGGGNDTMVNGDDTYFRSIRALGGGHGAGSVSTGASGGSGGGSGRGYLANGGSAILTYGRQGYDSYLPTQAYGYNQGGGGAGSAAFGTGAGPNGENASAGYGKQWIDGSTYYAGGGNGTAYPPAPTQTLGRSGTDGVANTGQGGGLGLGSAANGGSGVVIIAIPVIA